MVEHLGVRLLGEFELTGADISILRSRKARTLLKVLALADGATVHADELVDALWGAELPGDPAADLAVLASRARSVVGADRLPRHGDGYALRVDCSDRAELTALASRAGRCFADGDLTGADLACTEALALVRGPLLADEPRAEWVDAPRAAAAAIEAEVRLVAGQLALVAGRPGDALREARAVLAHDPYDELAVRLVMRAHVAVGRHGSALASYAALRERLSVDLGVSPNADTEALHTSVLRGEAGSSSCRPDRWFVVVGVWAAGGPTGPPTAVRVGPEAMTLEAAAALIRRLQADCKPSSARSRRAGRCGPTA